MYTKEIVLEDITYWNAQREIRLKRFRKLEAHWEKRRKSHEDGVYCRVHNPFDIPIDGTVNGYVRLFHLLLEHEYAYELSVKNPGEGTSWTRLNIYPDDRRDITAFKSKNTKKLEEMAEKAFNDKMKDNYLEMKFKESGAGGDPAKIEFREHDGLLVGYQVDVPFQLRGLFTVALTPRRRRYERRSGRRGYIHALWVPDSYDLDTDRRRALGIPARGIT